MSCDILADTGFVCDEVAMLDAELTVRIHKYPHNSVKQV
jgi:hypothetical protein